MVTVTRTKGRSSKPVLRWAPLTLTSVKRPSCTEKACARTFTDRLTGSRSPQRCSMRKSFHGTPKHSYKKWLTVALRIFLRNRTRLVLHAGTHYACGMYIPEKFKEERVDVLHALMQRHPLATVVASGDSGIIANHIPLEALPAPAPLGELRGHIARANPLWRQY